MHRPATAVVLGVMLLGCGRIAPGTSTHLWTGTQKRPCAESIEARAAGTFEQLAAKIRYPYLAYHDNCAVACHQKKDAAACAEAAALTAQYRQVVVYDAPVVTYTGPSGPTSFENPGVASAIDTVTRDLYADGWQLQSDTVLSLQDTGFASLSFVVSMSLQYYFVLIADRGTTFTAGIGGGGFELKSTFQVQDLHSSVYVVTTGVELEDGSNPGELNLSIKADGGDRGTVHALRFEKWR